MALLADIAIEKYELVMLLSMAQKKKKPCIHQDKEDFIEKECESTQISCTESSTSTGNILDRIIYDPSGLREPVLRKWPVTYPGYDEVPPDNPHQYKASTKMTQLNQMCCLRVDSTPNTFRQPAIIGTLGPSCITVDSIIELFESGMNIARVNMAHIDACNRKTHFQNVIEASNKFNAMVDYNIPIGIMMDLRGPDIRTGRIEPRLVKDPAVAELFLQKGRTVRLLFDRLFENRCSEKFIFIDYEGLPLQVQPGSEIHLGRDVILHVESIESLQIVCNVKCEGILKNYQQVHVAHLPLSLPPVTEYDLECLDIAAEYEVDVVVIPKTRNENTIYSVKRALAKKTLNESIAVFAKISNYEGIENIDKIIAAADGIVIHKNDLAVEVPPTKIFIAVKEIIAKCNKAGKPVVSHVQMHSNFSDIAQCVIDGTDCLMVTEETALGSKGPQQIRLLCEVIREAEAATMHTTFFNELYNIFTPSVEPSVAIALAAVDVANKIRSAAIVTITTSGRTAQLLSWFRPRCPVIAVTRVGKVARQLNLWRAVIPLLFIGPAAYDWFEDCESRIRLGVSYGKEREIIKPGDPLILVTGYRKNAGFTNCLRVVFASLEDGKFLNHPQKQNAT